MMIYEVTWSAPHLWDHDIMIGLAFEELSQSSSRSNLPLILHGAGCDCPNASEETLNIMGK